MTLPVMTINHSADQAITPEKAIAERARRQKARNGLVAFSEYVSPWYQAYRHHVLTAKYLEAVELYIRTGGKEGIGRLMVFEPPRHGKTEQCSRMFPAWLLGKLPDSQVILTSYNQDLANANSKGARDLLCEPLYHNIFGDKSALDAPVELSPDNRSVTTWELAGGHRGIVVAAGVGGGLTGKGAHLLVVDDPFKGREEAERQTERERVWDWWRSTAYTRLEKGGAVVLIMTRWHPDDLAGRLLNLMASDPLADQYAVLSLPAINESMVDQDKDVDRKFEDLHREKLLGGIWINDKDPLGREEGEALWPEKYALAELEKIKVNSGLHEWTALYQQQPVRREGSMFKREWFHQVDAVPEDIVARVRYWDKAGTAGGDFTAGVLMAIDSKNKLFVEHVVRGRWSAGKRDEIMRSTAVIDGQRKGPITVIWHAQDPGSAGIDSARDTARLLAGFPVHSDLATGSKETRADPLASQAEAGFLSVVKGAWNEVFIDELCLFPQGKNDDQVDAASGAYAKVVGRNRSGIW